MITLDQLITTKERFYVATPIFSNENKTFKERIPQSQFLRELDTNGHKILSDLYYPDIWKKVPNDDKNPAGDFHWIVKHVERVSIAIQQMILYKRLTHLCGDKMSFYLMSQKPEDGQKDSYVNYKQKWLIYNMDTAFYDFAKSVLATGDGAICLFRDSDGLTDYKTFSILNGDILHPIRDFNGKVRLFGREFSDVVNNIDAASSVNYLEVWDDTNYYLFSSDSTKEVKGLKYPEWDDDYGVSVSKENNTSWFIMQNKRHGFKHIPIEYVKNENGACWSPIQHLADALERALSEFFENNKSYAFRIMYIQGGFEVQADFVGNSKEPTAILLNDSDSKVGFVEGAEASGAFKEQLAQTLNFIKIGGFIVFPPENISGDTSGTAIKILYSPAIEKAKDDIHFFNRSIRNICNLFKESISLESDGSPSDYNNLIIKPFLNPYIPQNDQENINNMAVAIGAGYFSKESAREHDNNCAPDEAERVENEKEEDTASERTSIVGNGEPAIPTNQNSENTQRELLSDQNNGSV
jgi:hypothetical protein